MGSKKGGSGSKTHTAARKATDGRFTTKEYAKRHPSTTVVERVPNPGHGDTGNKKK